MSKTLNARIVIRNNTAANWSANNSILLSGEIGIESDTRKFKFGDGVTAWNSLQYASSEATGYMLASIFSTVDPAGGYVDKAKIADKLKTARSISVTGDASGSQVFDGSGDITLTVVLANVVTAGTGCKITVNAKGQVTGIAALAESDIPALTAAKITDLGTAATKNAGNAIGNVVVVNDSGKIDDSLISSVAITDVFESASQAEMLELSTANVGDICIRSDLSKTFILKTSPYSLLANWKELKTPTDVVISVNGQTGAITLTTANIAESTNLYYTEVRATANFNTNFAAKAVGGLSDGSHVLLDTDTLILDGGN